MNLPSHLFPSQKLQNRRLVHNPSDLSILLGIPTAALNLLPPVAYAHQPASSVAVKFAGQAPSKTRSGVNMALWTPDGRRCLTGTQAGEFCMWDGQSFQFETIIQAHETPVRAMSYTHGGNFLVSGDDAGTVRYWRTNLELVKSFSAHREAVRQIAFAPVDLKFATASDDSTIRVWDFARVTAEQVLAGHGGDVKCVDWHPSKSLLVSGSKDGLVKLWCPRSGRSLSTMHGHKGTITAAQWNGNGNWILTASRDQTCKVYDVRMQAELATFIGHGKDITQSGWHSVHEELFVSGGQDGSICFWLVGRQGPQAEVKAAHEGSIWTTAWHPSGHLLVTGASDAATKFWCRGRPGDPFIEQQEAEQAELAALAEGEAAAAAPVRAPAPALFAPPPPLSSLAAGGGGGAAIPGIGEAQAKQIVAPVDIYAAAAMPGSATGHSSGMMQGGGVGGGGGGGARPFVSAYAAAAPPSSTIEVQPGSWAAAPSDRDRGRDMDRRGGGGGGSYAADFDRRREREDRYAPPPSSRGPHRDSRDRSPVGGGYRRQGGWERERERSPPSRGRGRGSRGGVRGGPPPPSLAHAPPSRPSRYDSWRAASDGGPGPSTTHQQEPPSYYQPPPQQGGGGGGYGPPGGGVGSNPTQYGAAQQPPPHHQQQYPQVPPPLNQQFGARPPPGQQFGRQPPPQRPYSDTYPPPR